MLSYRYRIDIVTIDRIDIVKTLLTISNRHRIDICIESISNPHSYDVVSMSTSISNPCRTHIVTVILYRFDIVSIWIRHRFDIDSISNPYRNDVEFISNRCRIGIELKYRNDMGSTWIRYGCRHRNDIVTMWIRYRFDTDVDSMSIRYS